MKSSINRRQFLKTVGAGAALLGLSGCELISQKDTTASITGKRPNILFIYSDDHAAPAISAYQSFLSGVVNTPNLDRLANEGMKFENAFCTNSICTPSRANVLTGKYSNKNGVKTLSDVFDGTQLTFPKMLQEAGYYTGIIGKWHLKTQPTGFDYYNVLPDQGLYFDPVMSETGMSWWRDQDDERTGLKQHKGYVTDVITDLALDFLKNRPGDKPFCLMYQHKAPHDMWEYDPQYAQLYQDIDVPEPFNFFDDYENRGDAIKRCTQKVTMDQCVFLHGTQGDQFDKVEEEIGDLPPDEQKKKAYQYFIKAYLRCVASIDENVGRVLNYLDKQDLTNNTIVLYTSDQGVFLGEHGLFDKRFMYEESLRIPLLVRYPKEIKAGSVCKDFALNVDFSPTFLEYAGVKAPKEIDGKSLRPVFKGKTPKNWRTATYYRYWMHRPHFNVAGHYGIRTHRFKLIFYYGLPLDARGARRQPTPPEWELFDLEKDPYEMNNVYADPSYAGVVKGLKKRLLELKEECEDTDEKYPELMEVRERYW